MDDDNQPLMEGQNDAPSLGEDMIQVDIDKSEDDIQWNQDRIVWDLSELDAINKKRSKEGLPKVPVIKKHSENNLGIRAHTDMTFGKAFKSIFMPHQNEFIFIWLYFGFTVYFWVQFYFVAARVRSQYDFKVEEDYRYMLIATGSIAISLTVTLIYLIFYCMSKSTERTLKGIDQSFKIINIFVLTFVFLGAEMDPNPVRLSDEVKLQSILMITTAVVLILVLVLSFFDKT